MAGYNADAKPAKMGTPNDMAKGQTIKSRVRMALEGVRAGGLPIRRVVIKPDGGVDVIIGEPTDNKTETANDLDTWMEKHHAN